MIREKIAFFKMNCADDYRAICEGIEGADHDINPDSPSFKPHRGLCYVFKKLYPHDASINAMLLVTESISLSPLLFPHGPSEETYRTDEHALLDTLQ